MFWSTGSARCDNRNGEYVGQMCQRFIGISGFYTVMVHACEKYFSGSPFACFLGPVKQILFCFQTSSVKIAFPYAVCFFGVNGDNTYL